MILLPIFAVSSILVIITFILLILKIKKENSLLVLVLSILLAGLELFSLYTFYRGQSEVYVFAPFINISFIYIIIPAIISLILYMPKFPISNLVAMVISANVSLMFFLLLLYEFVLSNYFSIFDVFGVTPTY